MHRLFFLLLLELPLLCLPSCKKEQAPDQPEPINLSDDFSFCNSQLNFCTNGNGEYCLFGFKWGRDSIFTPAGFNAPGPASDGGTLTYSFQEENGTLNTHRQINLPSNSFDELIDCAKDEIRNALQAWSGIAAIAFEELPDNSASDIRFYTADIVQSGTGYPNYPDELCMDLAGQVVMKSGLGFTDCDRFRAFALHEIGHVLGLAHVETESIMSPSLSDFMFLELQAADSLGILALYGEK